MLPSGHPHLMNGDPSETSVSSGSTAMGAIILVSGKRRRRPSALLQCFFSLWKVALRRACVACIGGSAVC